MKSTMTHIILYIALALVTLPAAAQERCVERTWLYGAGRSSIYDAYLSPLDYKGVGGSMTMINDRTTMSDDHLRTVKVLLDINGSYTTNPVGNAHFYDAGVTVGAGYYYGWRLAADRVRVSIGGLAELYGGGTYSTRNGNNPAQGRASFDVAPSAFATYAFRIPPLRRSRRENVSTPTRCWQAKLSLDVPLIGVMFSPQYGQSYYELFSLHHYDHNVCFTWPVNAPSARLLGTLSIPVGQHGSFVLGYRGVALQSRVNHLGRHTWQNGGVIGFTRNF